MGRPRTEMTPAVEDKILKTIRLGLHPERAAQAHGVTPSTMRAHRRRHPEFATRIKEAEAASEASFLGRIIKHSEKNWTASAWIMERRWGERWGRNEPQEIEMKLKGKVKHEGPPIPESHKELSDYVAAFAAAASQLRMARDDDSTTTDPS